MMQYLKEGFWFSEQENHYPMPISQKKTTDDIFIDKLKEIMTKIKSNVYYDCEYIEYEGCSECRLCNKNNGDGECKISFDDIEYTFPEGLIHYYEDHNVHPSIEFYNFINEFPLEECFIEKPFEKMTKKEMMRWCIINDKIEMLRMLNLIWMNDALIGTTYST